MKDPEKMTASELERLGERVEILLERRRVEERIEEELPGRARFPRVDGERGWLEAEKVKCGSKSCKKGCQEGHASHGPYWYLYLPKEVGTGLTSKYKGRELPAEIADSFGLPPLLDASAAHRYSRTVREERLVSGEFGGLDQDETSETSQAAEEAPASTSKTSENRETAGA